jgi:predicted MFS family arabinose efflux permease
VSAPARESLSRRSVFFIWALAAATIGFWSLRFNVLPLLVSAVIGKFSVSNQQVGLFASALFAASTTSGVMTSLLLGRLNRRRGLFVALLCVSVGALLSRQAGTYPLFLATQVLTNAAGGVVAVLCYSLIGDLGHEDSVFGSVYAVIVLTGGLALYVLPGFIARFGLDGMLLSFAAGALALALGAAFLPAIRGKIDAAGRLSLRVTRHSAMGLTAWFLWSMSQSVYWVYVERIGHSAGISANWIGTVLAVATFGSGVAPAVGPMVSRRFGHGLPLMVCSAILFIALASLLGRTNDRLFALIVIGHALAWGLYEPYLQSLTALSDVSGRAVALISPVGGIGNALGPLLGAGLVSGTGLKGGICVSMAALVVSIVFGQLSIKPTGRENRAA